MQGETLPDADAWFGITSRLGTQVIQGRDRRGRRIACTITPLSARQQRRGIFREGLAVEQYVKNSSTSRITLVSNKILNGVYPPDTDGSRPR